MEGKYGKVNMEGKYGKTLDFECTPGDMLFMGKYGCR